MATSALPWVIVGGGILALGLVAVASAGNGRNVAVREGTVYRWVTTITNATKTEIESFVALAPKIGATDLTVKTEGNLTTLQYTAKSPRTETIKLGEPYSTIVLNGRETQVTYEDIQELSPAS